MEEFSEGWEGDPIIRLLIIGKGDERRVRIKTDRDKYDLLLTRLKVVSASDEFSMPLFDPENNRILIGDQTEISVFNGRDRRMLEKVASIAFVTSKNAA